MVPSSFLDGDFDDDHLLYIKRGELNLYGKAASPCYTTLFGNLACPEELHR